MWMKDMLQMRLLAAALMMGCGPKPYRVPPEQVMSCEPGSPDVFLSGPREPCSSSYDYRFYSSDTYRTLVGRDQCVCGEVRSYFGKHTKWIEVYDSGTRCKSQE